MGIYFCIGQLISKNGKEEETGIKVKIKHGSPTKMLKGKMNDYLLELKSFLFAFMDKPFKL